MNLEKPVTFRSSTWTIVKAKLDSYTEEQLRQLSSDANLETIGGRVKLATNLVHDRPWWLLIQFGLIADPSIMIRSIFSIGGLEFVITQAAANVLATGSGMVKIDILGGGKSRTFNYS